MGKTATEELVVRLMEKTDITAVCQIDEHTFADYWSPVAWSEELENDLSIYVVIMVGEQVVGFAGCWLVAGEAQITKVAMSEEYKRQGMGNVLLRNLLKIIWEAGTEAVTLEVRKSNEPARQLYLQNGFKETGVRTNYYLNNNEDALILWLLKE